MVHDHELRLVQVFLSRRGYNLFEVSFDPVNEVLVCGCPGFGARSSCKHVRHVIQRMAESDGAYCIEVPANTTSEDLQSPRGYRHMVLRYGTPVVL